MSFWTPAIQRRALAPAIGVGLTVLVSAIRAACQRPLDIDFSVFYESAAAWRSGHDLYATVQAFPNLNPPHFVVAFAPFTLLRPSIAIVAWTAFNVAAGIVTAVLIWRELGLPRSFVAVGTGIATAGLTTGLQFGLEEGQPTGLFALLFTLAWIAARRGKELPAGFAAGLLLAVKPFFVFVLVPHLVRRQWRALVASAAAIFGSLTIGIVLAGFDSYVRWIEVGRQVNWFVHPLNASISGLVARIGLPWHVWAVLSVGLALWTLVVLYRTEGLDVSWLVAGLASILISPLGWAYYVPLLAGPLTAVAIARPVILTGGVGFIWPLPMLLPLAPNTAIAWLVVYSIQTWSLVATWFLSVQPAVIHLRDRRAEPELRG